MIFRFQFGYGNDLTQDDIKKLEKILNTKIKTRENGEIIAYETYEGDIKEIYEEFPSIKLEVLGMGDGNNVNKIIKKLEKMQEQLEHSIEKLNHNQMFNSKVNVYVPGFGLMIVDEVDYMIDCCTEELQEKLDEGWKIIAACPQPDQRRPDYIIGRTRNKQN